MASRPAPFITPSATPPASHSFLSESQQERDSAPPLKRQRLASTSHSATPDRPVDFNQAREASALRLLDVWSQLAERYSRRIDEDDIVDLITGEIVKDRGVLRAIPNRWDFGRFADADHPEDAQEQNEEDDEESADELDTLTAVAEGRDDEDVPVPLERTVLPVKALDPNDAEDAEDLREFLEAERRRRETCGSEDGDSSVNGDPPLYDNPDGNESEGVHTDAGDATEFEEPNQQEDTEENQPQENTSPAYDSGSDDEIAVWEDEEASAVYLVTKDDEDESDNEIEIIDMPPPKPPSLSPQPARSKSKSPKKPSIKTPKTTPNSKPKPPQRQLYTPPQSQGSSSTPPDDYFIPLSSPPRSSHVKSSPSKPHSTSKPLPQKPKVSPRPIARFPTSDSETSQSPRLDLTKLVKGTKRSPSKLSTPAPRGVPSRPVLNTPRATPRPTQEQPPQTTSRGRSRSVNERPTTTPLSGKPKKPSQVEVLLSPLSRIRSRSQSHGRQVSEGAKSSPIPDMSAEAKRKGKAKQIAIPDPVKVSSSKTSKGKGRAVEYTPEDDDWYEDQRQPDYGGEVREESEDPITMTPSPTATPPKAKVVTRRPSFPPGPSNSASSSRTVHEKDQETADSRESTATADQEPEPVWMGTRKRKRVVSSSEVEVGPSSSTSTMTVSDERHWESGRRDLPRRGASDGADHTQSKPHPRRRSKSASRRPLSDDESHSDSEFSDSADRRHRRTHPRFPSAPSSDSFYPQFAPYSSHQPNPYDPLGDPRAQYIISQAMHQLSSLFTGPWTPPPPPHSTPSKSRSHSHPHSHLHVQGPLPPIPYTPTHQRHPSASSPMYSTPQHRTHPYPYSYDPNLSRGTLPPSSPEPNDDSPVRASSSSGGHYGRAGSLVRKSRSRGRRVSFRIEEGEDFVEVVGRDVDAMDVSSSPSASVARARKGAKGKNANAMRNGGDESPSRDGLRGENAHGKAKGKGKAEVYAAESSSSEVESPPRRGRTFFRGQTPGPVVVSQAPESRNGPGVSGSRTRTRSGSVGGGRPGPSREKSKTR